ncbi:hypothetical protein PAPYR_3418 [Paratrimastix pyriformis]|uniref:Homeobox domain-containing protein n=1 Tax=Paratrimastix pyriformis TaxID=342808 RepID=A0ABQ8UMI7_9EUKA|nr:hypothetical protein PAPYR_3418 [Paratrimastix pyriformis]
MEPARPTAEDDQLALFPQLQIIRSRVANLGVPPLTRPFNESHSLEELCDSTALTLIRAHMKYLAGLISQQRSQLVQTQVQLGLANTRLQQLRERHALQRQQQQTQHQQETAHLTTAHQAEKRALRQQNNTPGTDALTPLIQQYYLQREALLAQHSAQRDQLHQQHQLEEAALTSALQVLEGQQHQLEAGLPMLLERLRRLTNLGSGSPPPEVAEVLGDTFEPSLEEYSLESASRQALAAELDVAARKLVAQQLSVGAPSGADPKAGKEDQVSDESEESEESGTDHPAAATKTSAGTLTPQSALQAAAALGFPPRALRRARLRMIEMGLLVTEEVREELPKRRPKPGVPSTSLKGPEPGVAPKPPKPRRRWTDDEKSEMTTAYIEEGGPPPLKDMEDLARKFGTSAGRVRIWFNNNRQFLKDRLRGKY